MSPKEKALQLFSDYCKIIGSNCEHDSYCEDKECKIGNNTICKVTQIEAAACAALALNYIISECDKHFEAISKDRVNYWLNVKSELEKMRCPQVHR